MMQHCLNPYLIIYTRTPPWNIAKRLMKLRLFHVIFMFPHQNLMLSPSIITSYHSFEIQFQISHHTCSTSFNIPLRSKTTSHNKEQLIKHILAPISLKLETLAQAIKCSRLSESSNNKHYRFLRVLA